MKIEENKSLKELSTFKIGGNAKYYSIVESFDDLKKSLFFAQKNRCKVFILGKGSNCLFDDQGYNGLVIHNKISFCEYFDERVTVGAGFSISRLAHDSTKKNLSGFAFAAGIPASVGGAIYMNASANNQNISDVLDKVNYMDYEGKYTSIKGSDIVFSYRSSSFRQMNAIIISAEFTLKKDEKAKEKLNAFLSKKISAQPLNKNSAGCIFKNPENSSAGLLIEKCGLKGYKYNGAAISDKHANFIVNENNASSNDVLYLIGLIKKEVKCQQNVSLQTEICYVPY